MASPFQPLPPPVVGLALAVVAVEAVFQLGAAGVIGGPEAVGWRVDAIRRFGFFEPVLRAMLRARTPEAGGMLRFVSYPLLHLGTLHAVFGAALLLALGQAVAARLGAWALMAVAAAGSIGGALAYGLLQDGGAPLVGLYPLVYGLIGAFTQGLWADARDRRGRLAAFRLVGVLAAMQLAFRLGFGVGGAEWLAEVGGFVAGFALGPLVAPGGAARLRRWRERLRAR
jgi:membrane associated rhomboid family serine protease